ncbi:cationic amino acid transporter 4, vacuolar-like isoform X1 [Rhodamnia argentea]|uniref:Cationic amino acid transporter 4, vacuolar-like isoform X1 n=1 Tax=Rhodamnia argentea TaxID=178133 RepID=A0A8B8NU72_9MYRT|nr:cationic amino acid transporter 4, vacuolar-like isoform X1 [Rhodamnia argentea]
MRSFCGGKCSRTLRSLVRRKQVDSVHARREGHQLARRLSVLDIIAIGVGATVGAGVYILVGTVAREYTGPALTISFLIAGIAAALSAFCYAELACRCPSAGSAYHYTYICIGEGVAWLIGWSLILEYTIGGSAVARGISPNLAVFFGGENKLPSFLARHTIPGTGIVVDPCAAALVIVVTVLLCIGIKESSMAQTVVTTINVSAMIFIIAAGGYIGFKTGWVGYELPNGYFPYGVTGMLGGSAVVFFSYIGFDSVTSTAEEVKNPQRDLPMGIGIALSICCILYMLVSVVIVGLVPYYALDPDTPISSAFSNYGMRYAVYILTTGAVMALCSSLMGSILPQPRILMAMARDGLLPSFFADINRHTQVPVNSTVMTGVLAAALAFFMDVSQLAGMVSVGTLLAFTTVAVSVLILRYVPPDEVPFASGLQESIGSVSSQYNNDLKGTASMDFGYSLVSSKEDDQLFETNESSIEDDIMQKQVTIDDNEERRRKIASWSIAFVCVGILILASAASVEGLSSVVRLLLCGLAGVAALGSLVVLACIEQDDARHDFGHAGGFQCPFVPFLPVACILVNTYLLVSLGLGTWFRVSIWMLIGALVYIFYGRSHSSLKGAVYVPVAYAHEIYQASSNHQA